MPCLSNKENKKFYCKGIGGGGKYLCLLCKAEAAKNRSKPESTPLAQTVSSTPKYATKPTSVSSGTTSSSMHRASISTAAESEEKLTPARKEAKAVGASLAKKRAAKENFFGMYAYRGVNSDPRVYEGRGGFSPHQIKTQKEAIQKLKELALSGLDKIAFRWQTDKDKADGFFLSCGLNSEEAYDNYPYVYQINIGNLEHRRWDTVDFSYAALEVRESHLYTDNPSIEASSMIAVVCLKGGAGRSYELLIMSPCDTSICRVEYPKDSKSYVSFDEWKGKNPET